MGNGPEFFQTLMGRTFYEATMPQLVKQLQRLNENLQELLEDNAKYTICTGKATPAPPAAASQGLRRAWELCTAHIDERAAKALDAIVEDAGHVTLHRLGETDIHAASSVDARGEWGWYISVPEEPLDVPLYTTVPGLETFIRLLQRAQQEGFNFIVLDRDAEVLEGLDTYSW